MSRGGRKGSYSNYKSYKSYSYSGGDYKDADFVGIEWDPAYPGKFDNNTVYQPFAGQGEGLGDKFAVQFQVDKDEFEVAAAYSFDGVENDLLAVGIGEALGLDPQIAADLIALPNDNYDLVAAVELEGHAKEGEHDGYARNFIVGDEIEAYVALINDNGTPDHSDDTNAFAIEVEVELTKKGANKFDALFDGGRNIGNALSMMQSMSSSQLNRFVEEIEITIDVDTTDPVIPILGAALSELAPQIVGLVGDAFDGIDIEVEFGSVEPSKWAHEAIHELLATVNTQPA
jgi:hypothetical protein